jgi:1-acyl-sn-glycerol-3-phosphate acyltransferase
VTVRRTTEERNWAWNLAVGVLKPPILAAVRREWHDGEKIPAEGGCLVVFNHISHIDPLMAAHFVYDHGRLPHYLAKSTLFKNKILGGFLRTVEQIPVERLTRNAVGAYDAAVAAVRDGQCVVVYPEGTLTRDPGLWPMQGKSGAARIALETGCPVIPVGQWGSQELLAPYAKKPDLVPRKTVLMKAGDPVDLADLVDQPHTPALIAEATERIMAALTELVADLRDEPPPAERFDPRKAGVKLIGNPNEKPRKRRSGR